MRTFNQQIATNLALNTNQNSAPSMLKNIYMYTMAFIVTGTPNGTVVLQASNDPETNDTMPNNNSQPQPTNWVTITGSSFTLSASGETMWNVSQIGYNWVRVQYTDASGGTSTATAKIVMTAKGV